MLEQRVIDWINAEIDGDLSPGDQASLQAVLDSSEEARTMRTELQRLAAQLDNAPRLDPPEGLAESVIDRLASRTPSTGFSLANLFRPFQPAPVGLAFAAGLLAAVVFYELTPGGAASMDTSSMVGTMVAGQPVGKTVQLDELSIEQAGITGNISLQARGEIYVLNFDLDSGHTTEIEISLAEAGLGFGGIAHAPGDGPATVGSIEITGGGLRVVNQGRQAFFIFLSGVDTESVGGRELSIEISTGGAQVYSGVLRV